MKKILIKFSGVFFVVIITVILFLLYYLWGPSLGWMEPAEKFRVLCTIFAVPVFLSLLLVSRYSLVAFASRLRFFHKLNDKQNTWSNNSAHLKQVDISKKIINDVQQVLRHTYGHFWHSKVRILLMTGSVSDVEQLAPKLTRELWQEDRGTVLLWGGDPATPADADWLAVLRKLRRRAVDGMVWVTSALDVLPATENSATSGLTPDAMDSVSHALKLRYEALGWKLPLYVWSLHPRAGEQAGRVTQPVGCLLPANCSPQTLAGQLTGLIPQLTAQGIQQVCGQPQHNFLLALADQLTRKPETVTEPLSVLLNPYRPQPLAGVVFSAPSAEAGRSISHHWGRDNRWDILPDRMTELPAGLRPRKQGVNWMRGMSVATAALMLFWAATLLVSFIANRELVTTAQQQVQQASAGKQPLAVRLHALSALQKTLSQLEYRSQHGAPWYRRAGLSQNDDLLAALFPRYGERAQPLLRDAAAHHLEEQLTAFVQLPPDSPLREKMTKTAYGQLKQYLMLTRPEKMDAAWFATTLMQDWPQRSGIADAVWQGSGPSLLAFYAASLASHPQWRLPVDDGLVSQVRTRLIRQMGQRNSESTLYQKMLAQVANQYADMRLADMTADTDASRLFSTDEVVPGMFTRQAWEQAVQPAIEKVVAERRDEMDWVLSDTKQPAAQSTSPEALRARLAERYFADFSGAWLDFLNSLRWQRAATLSDAIDQLTLMADVRQSPLVALMNTLSVQGRTGQTGEAIADSLVKSARQLFNRDNPPAIDQQSGSRVLWMPPSGPYWRCWTIATAGHPPAVLACRPS